MHGGLRKLTSLDGLGFRTEEGHEIDVRTIGIVEMSPDHSAKVFNLQPDMSSVPFGFVGQ